MRVYIEIINHKGSSYEFSNMEFIPLVGEKIIVSHGDIKFDELIVISREIHISLNCEQRVFLTATKK